MPERIVFLAVCAVWIASDVWIGRRYRSADAARTRDQGTLRMLHVVIWIAMFVAIFVSYLPLGRIAEHRQALYATGIAMMIIGLAFRWWAIRVLDRFFTVDVSIRDDHGLVREGPYRWLRHPSYTGALLTFYGCALALANWVSMLLIVVPITAVFLLRMRVEEGVLARAFPDAYPAYARDTKRLVPFVW